MARELSAILTELNSVYNPQRDLINKQVGELDPMQKAEEQGLEYAKKDAFDQITNQANRRGLFYSGIPVQEEQRYTGGTFLPAVANLRSKYAQQRFNLQDALNKLQADQYSKAYDIRNSEIDNETRAAAARSAGAGMASPSLGLGGGGGSRGGYGIQQRGDKGFNFVDPYGRSVSAATYAAANGIPFRQLLQQMANAGDVGARQALGFVGDDYRYDTGKINQGAGVLARGRTNMDIYNALTWGAGISNGTARTGRGQGGGGGGW